jgi:uncharacterized Zn-finger protein
LAKEWDYERNAFTPDKVAIRTDKKYHWICRKDPQHRWKESVNNRQAGSNCPYCSGRKFIVGVSDLQTVYPEIAKLWDKKANGSLSPNRISATSHTNIHWVCDKDTRHKWTKTIDLMIHRSSKCPYCRGKKIMRGCNDLATLDPELASQWDPHKNDKTIYQVSPMNSTAAWWTCAHGHSWSESISKRHRKKSYDCPYCTNPKVGYAYYLDRNLMETMWDDSNAIPLDKVKAYDLKEYCWHCKNNHKWLESVRSIYRKNPKERSDSCPYCSDRSLLKGYNDLASKAPNILKEWDWEANDQEHVYPDDVLWRSEYRAHWVCQQGHRWRTGVYHRSGFTHHVTACPYCSQGRPVSTAEKEVYDYIKSLLPHEDVIANDRTILDGKEMDIYVPSLHLGIEYNGLYWHSELQQPNVHYHEDKWALAEAKGVNLIQIWEDDWSSRMDIVKDSLRSLCHVNNAYKDNARSCSVRIVPNDESSMFFNANHIQGAVRGCVTLGLVDPQGALLACFAYRKNNHHDKAIDLVRYATLINHNVRGGLSKLLSHAIEHAHGSYVYTFSDHCASDGSSYKRLGFAVDKVLHADYSYVRDKTRQHKFNYRLKNFRDSNDLWYAEGYSEKALANANGLFRLYDAGKTRWIYKKP